MTNAYQKGHIIFSFNKEYHMKLSELGIQNSQTGQQKVQWTQLFIGCAACLDKHNITFATD